MSDLNHICFYGGGVGIDLSKLHDMKLKQNPPIYMTEHKETSLDQFIELLVKFRDNNPGSGGKPVMIENIDAPGLFSEMSYFQPNGIERIVSFEGELMAISIGAGEV